ncbi:MAG: RagB/SusD family nutrient uptake outer membrane protein [Bacteroidetes bacterium]|nr:RagB/SusD family nutrient uptake outer membrane protein [Bacteroidota bacterium]
MKKLFILSMILFAAVTFYSCKKFLDLQPQSQGIAVQNASSDSILYKTAQEVESALAGAYSDFKNEYYELDYYVNGDAQADDAYAGADNPANFQIDALKIDAINSNVSRDWAYLYSTIGKTNSVINNVNSCPDAALTADRKKQIISEASFIRAFMYFQLVQLWGDVPLQLKEVTSFSASNLAELYPQLFPPRAPMANVYKQIILDLETALANVQVSATNKGYATKGAVNSMLAYVYATQLPHDYAKVQQYCDAVIGGGYSLMPNYNDLWNNQNKNCAESIFEINYTGGATDGNWGTNMFRGLDWKKFNIPSNDLVFAFDAEGDTVRKNNSIIFLDITGHWSDPNWPQTHYPFLNKWRNFESGSNQNYIFIRLADMILLKAEALNEQGDAQGAAALVNQIRHRAKLGNTPASTQDAMRLAIEKERRLELAFEGRRWYDLKRNGRAIEVMNNAVGPDGQKIGYNLTQNGLVWPIPQSEMDKNVNLVQNPGY